MKTPATCSRVIVALAAAFLLVARPAHACTRCMRVFGDGAVIVGRSMDWVEDPGSEIWVFPRGMSRQGNAGPRSFEWTSKHGSVGVSFYGVATACGSSSRAARPIAAMPPDPSSLPRRSMEPTSRAAGW